MSWKGTFNSNMYGDFVRGDIELAMESLLSNKVEASFTYRGNYQNGLTKKIVLQKDNESFTCTISGQKITLLINFINPETVTGFYSTTGPIDLGSFKVNRN
jgi:hypothetical protein